MAKQLSKNYSRLGAAALVLAALWVVVGAVLVIRQHAPTSQAPAAFVPSTLVGTVSAVNGAQLTLVLEGLGFASAGSTTVTLTASTTVTQEVPDDPAVSQQKFAEFQAAKKAGSKAPPPSVSTLKTLSLADIKVGDAVSVTLDVPGGTAAQSILILPPLPASAPAPASTSTLPR